MDIGKVLIILFILILILAMLTACRKKELNPKTVTYLHIGAYPMKYEVYVISDDKCTYYDLTEYYFSSEDGYSYFLDPLPSEDKYKKEESSVPEGKWQELVTAINKNNFAAFPEKIENRTNITDIGSFYIQVITRENERFCSGGWAAGRGNGRYQSGFKNIMKVINEIIKG